METGSSRESTARAVDERLVSASPRSLFDGVDAAVCAFLGIASLRHRSALHELGRRAVVTRGSVAAALDTVASNWERSSRAGAGSASKANWRWCVPQTAIGEDNRSPEVLLERAIAKACVAAGRTDWSNQVPIASGVVRPSAERRRAIDLVHQLGEGHFEFIELKIASDTPLYAAFEIISYAGVWLVSRHYDCGKQLLEAKRIDLRVLAPAAYYNPYSLGRIERTLNEELQEYGKRYGAELSFGFQVLPAGFEPLGRYRDDEVLALINGRRPL